MSFLRTTQLKLLAPGERSSEQAVSLERYHRETPAAM
eukprot:CAMPEP_0181346958 /NCGR_PEP_ID=MMETSP1101-20121128/33619_1 /TAXON_ID=46948 /ORGANISM="Rhodomonas abbreviata, Strain Caron Lab Isolate" /LENGTH=36 /DNA_ID= /DNA_START= /DNA_END= /DNA_ORIENTATION=